MGLTIQYQLRSNARNAEDARRLVEQLCQRAMDLPFKEVDDILDLTGPACDFQQREKGDPNRWLLIQAQQLIERDSYEYQVAPKRLIAFSTWPGEGSEPANFGLCRYPRTVEGYSGKKVKTGLPSGWFWRSFCKTQYSSNPDLGGIESFLRCHLSVIRRTFSDDNADRGKGYEGGMKSHRGWSRPDLVAQFDRFSRESSTNVYWRHLAETAITGSQRGNGRLGADYWKALRNDKGRRMGRSHDRYPESTWRNLFIPEALLAPGPDGPAATDEMEAYREGVQECEARIAIERALGDEAIVARLGAELVRRCETYLENRHLTMWLSLSDLQLFYNYPGATWGPSYMASSWRGGSNVGGSHWFLASGYQQRTLELFTLAGEVEKKLGTK